MLATNICPNGVLILSHMYPRDNHPSGGIFVHEQVKGLRNVGIDARVLSGEPFWVNTLNPISIGRALRYLHNYRFDGWEDFDGVPLLRFPYVVSRFIPFQLHAFLYAQGSMRCKDWLETHFKFDLIHAHTSFTDGAAAGKMAQIFNVPFVITEHTGPFRTLTRTPYLKRKTQNSINAADRLIAVSQSLLSDILEQVHIKNLSHTLVLPNIVDVDHFCITTTHKNKNCVRILWVGHFVPVKRVSSLLQAFAIALKENNRLILRLVGSGDDEDKARQLAKSLAIDSRVEFVGYANRNELVLHYHSCDFLVISSESETFGVVAIEAMSCGCPVLTTNCGGPTEIVSHPRLGLIVEHSPNALAEGIVAMVEKLPQFNKKIIRDVVEKRYSKNAIVSRLISVYADILKTH